MAKKDEPTKGKFIISYSLLGISFLILIVIIAVTGLIDYKHDWDIELKDYISFAAFGTVTIGLIYNAISLQYNYKVNEQRFLNEEQAKDYSKKKLTYDLISEWYKQDMATNVEIARRFITPFKSQLNRSEKLNEFKAELEKEDNLVQRKSLTSVLNYFENLALYVDDKVIDEDILKKAFRTAFLTYYDTLKEYIEDEQRGNSGANAKIFIHFVNLTKAWTHQ